MGKRLSSEGTFCQLVLYKDFTFNTYANKNCNKSSLLSVKAKSLHKGDVPLKTVDIIFRGKISKMAVVAHL